MPPQIRILFVCTGNICRSPTAEGVFRDLVSEAGLADRIATDSAGPLRYHMGTAPDPRAVEAAARRGVDIGDLRARHFDVDDFASFDYILAMDSGHVRELSAICPERYRDRVRLFLNFADLDVDEVPDPFGGDAEDFERVLDLVENGSTALLEHVRRDLA